MVPSPGLLARLTILDKVHVQMLLQLLLARGTIGEPLPTLLALSRLSVVQALDDQVVSRSAKHSKQIISKREG